MKKIKLKTIQNIKTTKGMSIKIILTWHYAKHPIYIYFIYVLFHFYVVCWSNVTKITQFIKTKTKENTYKDIIN